MGESKIVVLRLESTDRSTACLVQRAGGFVFLVGKYRNGLKEDLWYTWRIFQVSGKKLFCSLILRLRCKSPSVSFETGMQ